ncbi:MAG: hypothetical protein ACRD50_03825 [Candidatus Acidiferrales bacterium]
MIAVGVAITAATVTILVLEFLRWRSRAVPLYGWAGLAALVAAEWLMFRGVEPVATFFTPIAWSAYILFADAAVFAVRGSSRLRNSPAELARVALLSIPLWLIFEAYNLRLVNWAYSGVPMSWPAAILGYAWSFATITPGIFETADLIESFGWFSAGPPRRISPQTETVMMIAGAACLFLPLVTPRHIGEYLFGPVWLGFYLLLDPLNRRLRLPSLVEELARGSRAHFCSLLAAGWVCGWLWEFWNYWAAAKWHYIFPIFQGFKIFEMPAPGFLGFLPFALECFVMYVTAEWLLGWRKRGA